MHFKIFAENRYACLMLCVLGKYTSQRKEFWTSGIHNQLLEERGEYASTEEKVEQIEFGWSKFSQRLLIYSRLHQKDVIFQFLSDLFPFHHQGLAHERL